MLMLQLVNRLADGIHEIRVRMTEQQELAMAAITRTITAIINHTAYKVVHDYTFRSACGICGCVRLRLMGINHPQNTHIYQRYFANAENDAEFQSCHIAHGTNTCASHTAHTTHMDKTTKWQQLTEIWKHITWASDRWSYDSWCLWQDYSLPGAQQYRITLPTDAQIGRCVTDRHKNRCIRCLPNGIVRIIDACYIKSGCRTLCNSAVVLSLENRAFWKIELKIVHVKQTSFHVICHYSNSTFTHLPKFHSIFLSHFGYLGECLAHTHTSVQQTHCHNLGWKRFLLKNNQAPFTNTYDGAT